MPQSKMWIHKTRPKDGETMDDVGNYYCKLRGKNDLYDGVFWVRTFKCLWGSGIDSKEWIPPAYVAWRAGTKTLFLLGA